MKIYLVSRGEYSDRSIVGAFSTEEKAKAYRDTWRALENCVQESRSVRRPEARGHQAGAAHGAGRGGEAVSTRIKRVRREMNKVRPFVRTDRLASMRVPLWRKVVGVFSPGVVVRWVRAWKAKDDKAERIALKHVSHKIANGGKR